MNFRTLVLALLLLALLFLCYFLGCFTGASCTDTLQDIPLSDSSCKAVHYDFAGFTEGADDPLSLSGGEPANGRQVRYGRVSLPPNSTSVYLTQYLNFPGETRLEFYDFACGETATLLGSTTASGIANVVEQALPTGLTQVVVRALVTPQNGYNYRPIDKLTFAAFTLAPDSESDINGQPLACGGGANQRLVVTSNNPTRDLVAELGAMGLNVAALCDCNPNLVVVDVPPGIDLESLKPKLKESDNATQASTDSLFMDEDSRINPNPIMPGNFGGFNPNQSTQTQAPVFINDQPALLPDFEIIWPEGQNSNCLFWDPPFYSNMPDDAVRVAIVDSGADTDFFFGFTNENSLGDLSDNCYPSGRHGYDHVENDDTPDDVESHGTMVATTLSSRMSDDNPVRFAHYKFYAGEEGSYFDALCAMHTAMAQESRVINTSWGFYADSMPETLEECLKRADSLDVIIVAAAGNDSLSLDSLHFYPAAATTDFPLLLSVGSYEYLDDAGNIGLSAFSNYSPDRVDLLAYHTMGTITFNEHGSFIAFPRGTSISAPQLSKGLMELIAANPGIKAGDAIQQLFDTETELSPALNGQAANGRFLVLDCE